MKLYPVFTILLFISCHNIELEETNNDLKGKITTIQWINTYDSLEKTTMDYYKMISDTWSKPGFVSFGWHDSLWHFIYGNVRLSFNVETLLSIKNKQIQQESISSINESFTTSVFYALLAAKFFVVDSLKESTQQFNYYLKEKGNENIVWAVRKLPKEYDSVQLSKFAIYILHIDPTGHKVKYVKRFRIGKCKSENNDVLVLDFVSSAIPMQGVYCALHYKRQFRKVSIETLEHNIILESQNGNDEWDIVK